MSWSDAGRAVRFAALAGAILAALAACQPVPQPFAHDGKSKNPFLVPSSDTGGITVLSVAGAPDATAETLLSAMADSLAEHEIPAATGTGNRLSRFVQASAAVAPAGKGRLKVELIWDLFDRGGALLGTEKVSRTIDSAEWDRPDRRALRSLTDGAAAKFASLVLYPSGGPGERAAPPLHVRPVDGMKPDDGATLRQAMATALRRRNFTVFPAIEGAGLVISGHFSAAGPPGADPRPVEISWTVLDAAGRELGKLTQRNTVPAADLASGWKTLAAVIAENAAGGIGDMIQRLPPEAFRKAGDGAK